MNQILTKLLCVFFFFSSNIFSQPFWNSGGGPYGGTILDFAFNSQNHIYGAGYQGLFKSTNDGQNWEPVSPEIFSIFPQVYAVEIDQMDYIYVATPAGVFKSIDNGSSWSQINNGLTFQTVISIGINSEGVLFAGSYGYIFRSEDGGDNWTETHTGIPAGFAINEFTFDPATDEIFIATSGGVYTSTDNGDSWTDISSGLPANSYVSAIDLSPSTSRQASEFVYAATSQGVYRYSRVLLAWVFLATGLGPEYIYALTVNAAGDLFVGTALGIFRHLITDNQWTQLNVALVFSYVTCLAISPLGYILAAEDWGGPLISMNNGNNWIRIITGLTAYGIISFYYSHLLNKFFMGSDAGYFKGLAALTGWTLMYPQLFPFFLVTATVYSAAGYIFAGTYFQGMWRSSDEGVTWEEINTGLTSLLINAVIINALGHLYVATQGGGVFFSDNNGDSWTALNAGLSTLFVTCLILSPLGQLFVGTSNAGIFRYDFNASQWVQLITTGLASLYITAMAVNLLGDIFAVVDGSVIYHLASGATTWIALGLTAILVHDLIIRRSNSRGADEIYAATFQGVYSSSDNGTSWDLINSGIEGSLPVSKFAADSSGGIYLALGGRGALQGGGEPNIINLTGNEVPDRFILNQNYPNPFNPSTTISFSLPKESFTTLEIFNSIGQKIKTLVYEFLLPGTYAIEWNAEALPTGVYFYRLSVDKFYDTKKLLLLK